jgi:hypothetical protein
MSLTLVSSIFPQWLSPSYSICLGNQKRYETTTNGRENYRDVKQMKPERKARGRIDQLLDAAGWKFRILKN